MQDRFKYIYIYIYKSPKCVIMNELKMYAYTYKKYVIQLCTCMQLQIVRIEQEVDLQRLVRPELKLIKLCSFILTLLGICNIQ